MRKNIMNSSQNNSCMKFNDYLKLNYKVCPKCKSTQLLFGDLNAEKNILIQTIDCLDCEYSYEEIYGLINIKEVK